MHYLFKMNSEFCLPLGAHHHPIPSSFLLGKTRTRQNRNFIEKWDHDMSWGNWTFLFLGKDVLETIFNTASKKKKGLVREREMGKKYQKRKKSKFIAISQAHEIRHQNEKRAVLPLECTPIVLLKSGPQCFLLSGEASSQEPHHVVNSYINLSDSF